MALGGSKKGSAGYKASSTIKRLEGLRKDATRTVSFRVDPHTYEQLEIEAKRQGLRISQLVKSYVTQGLHNQ